MTTTRRTDGAWSRGAVGYEVYIRSFADSDGDGVGDLEGLRRHLDHLAWLGVDVVWITPFYPSPGFDHGYDVSDYRDVDPRLGDLDVFRALLDDAHALGLRVVVDITPNHSSSHHPLFRRALEGRDNPFRDWYLWADPAGDGGPPNNWVSHFGGSAWTLDEASGQYYCHLFLPEQPDFNWRNDAVREYMLDTLRFWLDLGADGFRIDVAHGLLKDPQLRDNPLRREIDPDGTTWQVFNSYEHIHDLDQEETPALYRAWREVAAAHDAVLIGEIGLSDPARIARYVDDDGLDLAFYLEPGWEKWNPALLLEQFRAMYEAAPDRMAWILDNHDQSRSATRFGGGTIGADRSLALMTLLFGLGGMPFLYQGQELGIGDGQVAVGDMQDPIATQNAGQESRDGSRTAMPWSPGSGNGFTTGTPWLAAADRPPAETVSEQRSDPTAPLHRMRRLIEVHRSHPYLWLAPAEWLESNDREVAVLRRGSTMIVANLAPEPRPVHLDGSWTVLFGSRGEAGTPFGPGPVEVPRETTLVLERSGDE